jgi:hypothetical protein
MKEPMNADQRLAEFLSEEPIDEKDAPDDARSVGADAHLGAGPASRSSRRPVGARSRPRASSALRVARPDARLIALLEAMARRIRRQPLAALAVAIGAGFMLGGALSSRTGRAVVSAAARHLGRELLKQLL